MRVCVRGQIFSELLRRDSATLSSFCTNIAPPLVAATDPPKTPPYISGSVFYEPNNSSPVLDKHRGPGKKPAIFTLLPFSVNGERRIKKKPRTFRIRNILNFFLELTLKFISSLEVLFSCCFVFFVWFFVSNRMDRWSNVFLRFYH